MIPFQLYANINDRWRGREDKKTRRGKKKEKGWKFGNQTGIIKRAEGKGWKWMICIKRYHTVFRLRHCLVPLCCNEEPQSDNLWSERVTLERFSWGPQDQTSPSAKWAAEWATAWFISWRINVLLNTCECEYKRKNNEQDPHAINYKPNAPMGFIVPGHEVSL